MTIKKTFPIFLFILLAFSIPFSSFSEEHDSPFYDVLFFPYNTMATTPQKGDLWLYRDKQFNLSYFNISQGTKGLLLDLPSTDFLMFGASNNQGIISGVLETGYNSTANDNFLYYLSLKGAFKMYKVPQPDIYESHSIISLSDSGVALVSAMGFDTDYFLFDPRRPLGSRYHLIPGTEPSGEYSFVSMRALIEDPTDHEILAVGSVGDQSSGKKDLPVTHRGSTGTEYLPTPLGYYGKAFHLNHSKLITGTVWQGENTSQQDLAIWDWNTNKELTIVELPDQGHVKYGPFINDHNQILLMASFPGDSYNTAVLYDLNTGASYDLMDLFNESSVKEIYGAKFVLHGKSILATVRVVPTDSSSGMYYHMLLTPKSL